MRFAAPSISEHRLQRYQRWMLLWLTWFAAFLARAEAFAPFSDQAARIAHRWLDQIERILIRIIIIRAAPLVNPVNTPKHSAYERNEDHFFRAVIGSAMRRALRPRTLRQRIAALSQNLDALVARLLKRLPRGLTRRRAIRTRPERVRTSLSAIGALQAAFAPDSS